MRHNAQGHTLTHAHAYARAAPQVLQLFIHNDAAVGEAQHIIPILRIEHLLLDLQMVLQRVREFSEKVTCSKLSKGHWTSMLLYVLGVHKLKVVCRSM